MSYDNPRLRQQYAWGPFTFTANETFSILPPKGMPGRLIDYGVTGVTTVFAGSTSTPQMAVGTPSDQDAYGEEFDFGLLADNHGKSVLSTYGEASAGAATFILNDGALPADLEIVVTCIGGVGTPGGVATPFVLIHWMA